MLQLYKTFVRAQSIVYNFHHMKNAVAIESVQKRFIRKIFIPCIFIMILPGMEGYSCEIGHAGFIPNGHRRPKGDH